MGDEARARRGTALTGRLSGHWAGVQLRLGRSRIDGAGIFAVRRIPARSKIGEFGGELISQREARRRAHGGRKIAIVELNDGRAVDASRAPNWFRYINHSCNPNAYIRIFREHIEFYARRPIQAGEEVTCDYGESHHNGQLRCTCGAANCRGYI